MIRYCETHKKLVPEGDKCKGYGAVEYIDEWGMADLNRDPCRIESYDRTPSGVMT